MKPCIHHGIRSFLRLFPLALGLAMQPALAQTSFSTQSHGDRITAIVPIPQSSSFFTAGQDGFVIKWQDDAIGEHYQLSTAHINRLAKNPANNDIAVYESDDISLHRITALSWGSFNKKFSERFKDAVTCLSYSAKGTYLIVGTTAINGTYILNAQNGSVYKNITGISGVITMAQTGSSEKSVVLYSPSGWLYYYDLKQGKLITKFATEQGLEQPMLCGSEKFQNRFFAGVRNDGISVIDALNGKTIARYVAANPLILSAADASDDGLYYISPAGKGHTLFLIENETLEEQLKARSAFSPRPAVRVKNFTGLQSSDALSAAAKNQEALFLGTRAGTVYTMPATIEAESYSLEALSENILQKIYDIAADESDLYFLTEDAVYRSSYESSAIERIADNPSQRNILIHGDSLILWSKDTKKPVQKIMNSSLYSNMPETLFVADKKIQSLRVCGDTLVSIQGNSSVHIYDMDSARITEAYTGTTLEDAALVDGSHLYVAKSIGYENDSPLVSINLQTGETAPVMQDAYVVYSLSYDDTAPQTLYGIRMSRQENGTSLTEVFAFDTDTHRSRALLKLNDEDSAALTSLSSPYLYTNIGKNQLYAYNTKSGKSTTYKRTSSMPVKIESTATTVAVLNKDGSLSWYPRASTTLIATWYLTTGNEWKSF